MTNNLKSDPAELWYALITTYNELGNPMEKWENEQLRQEVINGNRRAWNGWVCRNMGYQEKETLVKKAKISPQDLRRWDNEETKIITQHIINFLSKNGHKSDLIKLENLGINEFLRLKFKREGTYDADTVDLSNAKFGKPIYANKFIFPNIWFRNSKFLLDLWLENAVFCGTADFLNTEFGTRGSYLSGAHFCHYVNFSNEVSHEKPSYGLINFSGVEFHQYADFSRKIFDGHVDFSDAKFHQKVDFPDASFRGGAEFRNTKFGIMEEGIPINVNFSRTCFDSGADFTEAKFKYETSFTGGCFGMGVNFREADFRMEVDFTNRKFLGGGCFEKTKFHRAPNFTNAIFKKSVPKFYDATMHKDTKFTLNAEDNWPDSEDDAEGGKNAYTHLIQLMRQQQKPDDEHFFYRQEMAWKAQHERSPWSSWAAINLYGCLSNYGYSLLIPFWAFLIALICPVLLVPGAPQAQGSSIGYWGEVGCALRLSATNMLPLFEFASGHNTKCGFPFDNIKWLWHWVSIVQYVLSVVFLFLFALALRNRFRLGA